MRNRLAGVERALFPALAGMLLLAPSALHAQSNAPAQTASVAQPASAAAPTFRAGLKSIAIPAPGSELVEIGPDYRVLFETFVPSTNRLIAAFVVPGEVTAIQTGSAEQLSEYALVEVPRAIEFKDVSPELFKDVANEVANQFGANLDTAFQSGRDEVNQKLKDLNANAASVTVEKPLQLGALFRESDAYGFGMISEVTAKGTSTKMAMGVLLARVQDRILFAYIYTVYKDADTVRWLTNTSQAWADAILKAN
jgi:hypothetical protein